jgi:hypothetical protein
MPPPLPSAGEDKFKNTVVDAFLETRKYTVLDGLLKEDEKRAR